MVDKRTMEKYEREAKELGRESWYLSWAMDLNSEERAKGKTVEYGRGYFETEKRRFTLLDAPGHKNFVPSMIEGASQSDVGILVISARKGEFETGFEKGGQTREHALLAKTVGVQRLIIAINKMDDPTVVWSKERYDECINKLIPFLKQVGFNPKTDVDFLPVSGFTGANIKERFSDCPYYSGPALLEILDSVEVKDRKYTAPFMMPLADKSKDMGTIVSGKIESGRIKKGQTVLMMPNKRVCEISGIFFEDQELTIGQSGDNVRLRLKGIEEEDIPTGSVLCSPNHPIHTVIAFEAQVAIVEHKSIICAGYTAVMHVHNVREEVTLSVRIANVEGREICHQSSKGGEDDEAKRIASYRPQSLSGAASSADRGMEVACQTVNSHHYRHHHHHHHHHHHRLHHHHHRLLQQALLHLVDKKTGKKSKNPPKFLKQGDVCIARIETLGGMVCLEPYKEYPQLGRFTLRDEGKTVAMGKVTKLILDAAPPAEQQ
ncbi:P-loop containing nucleoside triphosphate hydrolase protein [Polychytrium aggregatum]|uniref:P-loop containing nucleoside triphosphate hydrolase protein n=1 Tax=Polychytrium aggregatum TaxID=110093 RepID=UPI0022FE4FFF|nr:P-loop containing nucleoside triphosphate hydrolase protein [Polychytrium aggregatum]KAI9202504.1 P-loop containing nucleoside triphosphate hydrolase protein [Polychytrium aggregatum]